MKLLTAVKPTRKIHSVIYQPVDNTAISMTLAEGLVRRLKRETIEAQNLFQREMPILAKKGFGKVNKFFNALKELSANCGLITYEIETTVGKCIIQVRFDEERFQFACICADRKGYQTTVDYATLTSHAIARYIFRRRCTNFHELFREFVYVSQSAGHTGVCLTEGEEFSIPTDHGFCIYKVLGPKTIVCVTWVDGDKARPEQVTAEPYLTVIERAARKKGVSIMSGYGFTDLEIKRGYLAYQRTGGTETIEEFAQSKEHCATMINKLLSSTATPITVDTCFVTQI